MQYPERNFLSSHQILNRRRSFPTFRHNAEPQGELMPNLYANFLIPDEWDEDFYERLQLAILFTAIEADENGTILQLLQERLLQDALAEEEEAQPKKIVADKSWKKKLPRYQSNSSELKGKECSICMCDFEDGAGKSICKLPCKHYFHRSCIKNWLKDHNTCPICRYELKCEDPEHEKERQKRMTSQYGKRFALLELGSQVDRLAQRRVDDVPKSKVKALEKQLRRIRVNPEIKTEYEEIENNIQLIYNKIQNHTKTEREIKVKTRQGPLRKIFHSIQRLFRRS